MPYGYRSSGFGPSGSEEHSGFTTQQLKAHQEQLQRAGYEQARRRKPSQQSQYIGGDRSQVSRGRRSTRTDSECGVPGQSGHPAGGWGQSYSSKHGSQLRSELSAASGTESAGSEETLKPRQFIPPQNYDTVSRRPSPSESAGSFYAGSSHPGSSFAKTSHVGSYHRSQPAPPQSSVDSQTSHGTRCSDRSRTSFSKGSPENHDDRVKDLRHRIENLDPEDVQRTWDAMKRQVADR